MARFLESYPWAKESLCEGEAPQLVDEIIVAGSDEDESLSTKTERRRKRELIGKRYLRGYMPLIQSAQLLGPFHRNSGWSNTWGEQRPHATSQPLPRNVAKKHATTVSRHESSTLQNDTLSDFYSVPSGPEHDAADKNYETGFDDSEIPHHKDYQATEAPHFQSKPNKRQALQNDFNISLGQRAPGNSFIHFRTSKPGLAKESKRKAEATEDWLKGAHIIKRTRRENSQHVTPTPDAGAGTRRRNQNRPESNSPQTTTPVRSRLPSPKVNSISAGNLIADTLSNEKLAEGSGFTPLRSSGQPTPPSDSPKRAIKRQPIMKAAQTRDQSKHEFDEEKSPVEQNFHFGRQPEISLDLFKDSARQEQSLYLAPPGSFKYQKTTSARNKHNQISNRKNEPTISSQVKLPTIPGVRRSGSPDIQAWTDILQKNVVTSGDVDSPETTGVAHQRHNTKRENSLRRATVADDSPVVIQAPENQPAASNSEDETQVVADDIGKYLDERGQLDDASDLMDAVQSQLLSEANEHHFEEIALSTTPVITSNASPSRCQSPELKGTVEYDSETASEDDNPPHRDIKELPRLSSRFSSYRSFCAEDDNASLSESRIRSMSPRLQEADESSPALNDKEMKHALLKEDEPMPNSTLLDYVHGGGSILTDDQVAVEDGSSERQDEGEQSPWAVSPMTNMESEPTSSNLMKVDISAQYPTHLPQNDEKETTVANEHLQSPWPATALLPEDSYYSVNSDLRNSQEGVDIGDIAMGTPLAKDVALTVTDSCTTAKHHNHISASLDPFTSTQILVEAATANPWTDSGRKQRNNERKKRVSWGPLPSADMNGNDPTNSPRSSKHLSSPPPPQESLVFADPDDTFHQLLTAGRKTVPSPMCSTPSRSSVEGAVRRNNQATLRHVARGTPTQNSPGIDAMAEAFIAADQYGTHDSHNIRRKAEQASVHRKTSKKTISGVKGLREGTIEETVSSNGASPASFSITPNGNVTAICSATKAIFDDDEELGAVIDDMGSFLEGWDVDTELKKADRSSSGSNWRSQEYLLGI